ncbi:gamma-glutamyltransferase [Puniceibacterium sediminis]|uniref:Gamma-glutamyltransferase 1 Threonine peptidase. MEROPS family T03 n=1 Tax=Puniceibacterium sediminis TaxID=1608407 RepID=A0A238YDI4_9RHOB|nr:gamma-glutamyltransferase [Puniceibacterium sediminis]SNR69197.1 gamma-glutamyltransferase 1 Threonine peptidase. MEROPS family T03 [Puniceibacterium sediminis]
MSDALSRSMQIHKHVVETDRGVVASQHRQAAEAGAEVLRAGGDAVDAAVACGFVCGVLEPWMSGPAGGGAAMHWRADTGQAHALNFGMRSPAGLQVGDFALSGEGVAGDLFPWERVVEDRNVMGAKAIAVPAMVDGHAAAHKRWGRLPWAELLAPAIEHAKRGMAIDWYASLIIASATRDLARDPDAAAMFLMDGQWPCPFSWTALATDRINQARMADSLDTLARDGAAALHGGDLGAAMAQDVRDKGGYLTSEDLAANRAQFHAPLSVPYRDALFHVMPGLTAGPTFARAMEHLAGEDLRTPDDAYPAYARAMFAAYGDRLASMGHDGENPATPGCTTHFSVVDRDGNMVAHTQTLLSLFGSRVVSPSTGFLMNNGIMWFDPEQGRPNSLAAGKPCLMNVCPALGEANGKRFALGASGGRKIVGAVVQLASFLADFDMDLETAFHQPRIDVSGGKGITADAALSPAVMKALEAVAPLTEVRRSLLPYPFACPAGVLDTRDKRYGATEVMTAWGDAVAEPV